MKTNELTRHALDWAVSKCEGVDVTHLYAWNYEQHQYSTNWSQGGPIIEREKILVEPVHLGWIARTYRKSLRLTVEGVGSTPLIAAMRCYVASKLGDEVEVPEELR